MKTGEGWNGMKDILEMEATELFVPELEKMMEEGKKEREQDRRWKRKEPDQCKSRDPCQSL